MSRYCEYCGRRLRTGIKYCYSCRGLARSEYGGGNQRISKKVALILIIGMSILFFYLGFHILKKETDFLGSLMAFGAGLFALFIAYKLFKKIFFADDEEISDFLKRAKKELIYAGVFLILTIIFSYLYLKTQNPYYLYGVLFCVIGFAFGIMNTQKNDDTKNNHSPRNNFWNRRVRYSPIRFKKQPRPVLRLR